jgi:cyclopropane-fatty-acyl-phospholipid synthase
MAEPRSDRRATAARELLRRVFAFTTAPLRFRLWDGTTVDVGGAGPAGFTVVLRSWAVLRRLLRRPTPLRFGEAYIGGAIDIEGDVFAAMSVANALERMRVPLGTRLRVLAALLRV